VFRGGRDKPGHDDGKVIDRMPDRSLIVTADDFGMSIPVNEAVEEAHRKGVLTSASLVVAGDAAADAVERARRMPKLGVGLHLALVDAPSALPAEEIPDLVGHGQGLSSRPASVGAKIFFLKRARDQARAEMRAQLQLFRRTGLRLDHVDGHWHFHQHPTLTALLAQLAPEFGIRAARVPNEPVLASWRAAGRKDLMARAGVALGQSWLWNGMRRRLARAGVASNDWYFGLHESGAVMKDVLLGFIANLPPGVSEIGTHPATRPPSGPHALPSSYRVMDELQALTDPDVVEACRAVRLGNFSDLTGRAG
jgi:hopanoid biosynthesis associated protein HpnK